MLRTERLLLRPWYDEDVFALHAINQDPVVIRFLSDEPPGLDEVRSMIDRQRAVERDRGYCFWAAERRDTGELIGFCGLKPGPRQTPIAGDVEIGWRIASRHWRRGFAYEGASACLTRAWELGIPSVAAITVPANEPSWRLMEKLGFARDLAGDFNHPALPAGHRLSRHLTYRIVRPA